MKKVVIVFAGVFILFASSCTSEKAEPLSVGCTTTISYAADIDTIIVEKCESCHAAGGTGTGDFTNFAELKAKVDGGSFKTRVFTLKDMPQSGSTPLTEAEMGKLKCWIEQGAPHN